MLSGIIIIAFCAACTVKEDRSACPCVLKLDFSGVDAGMFDALSLNLSAADGFLHREVVQSESFGEECFVEVPRGGVRLGVVGGEDGCRVPGSEGEMLLIPHGSECPRIYMSSSYIDTDSEQVEKRVEVYKNYCRLSLKFLSYESHGFELRVDGNVCGYDAEGSPLEGDFSFEPRVDDEGECLLNVPRQVDGSLKLLLDAEDGKLREFALGEYIIDSGYDWEALSLRDLEVEIDYALTRVIFRVEGWEKTVNIEIVV